MSSIPVLLGLLEGEDSSPCLSLFPTGQDSHSLHFFPSTQVVDRLLFRVPRSKYIKKQEA